MNSRRWSGVAGPLFLASSLSAVAAQPEYLINPSLSIAAVVDDNIFGSPAEREHDYIARISPAIEAEYRGSRVTLQAGYLQDAELFLRHSETNTAKARQYGVANGQFRSTPQLTFELETSYEESERPNDFDVVTGLAGTRARASRAFVGPSMTYQFTPSTAAQLGYHYSKDRVKDGIGSWTDIWHVGTSHRFSARNTGLLTYEYQEFSFANLTEPVEAQVVLAGDTYSFSERTSMTLLAGPRFTQESPLSEESTDIDVSAQFRQFYETGELEVNYYRSQQTAINVLGLVDNHTFNFAVVYFPERLLEFRIMPQYGKSTLGSREATGYQLNIEVSKYLDRSLSLVAGYQYTQQEGTLNDLGGDRVRRNIVLVGLVYAPFALGKDGTMLLDNRTKVREGLLPRLDIR